MSPITHQSIDRGVVLRNRGKTPADANIESVPPTTKLEPDIASRLAMTHSTLLATLLASLSSATFASVPMPKPNPGDQGTYALLSEVRRSDGIIETLHHRAGPAGPTWSWNEVRCATQESREMATSYDGPDSPKGPPTRWTRVVSGSSKAMLVRFVCVRKADQVPQLGKP